MIYKFTTKQINSIPILDHFIFDSDKDIIYYSNTFKKIRKFQFDNRNSFKSLDDDTTDFKITDFEINKNIISYKDIPTVNLVINHIKKIKRLEKIKNLKNYV